MGAIRGRRNRKKIRVGIDIANFHEAIIFVQSFLNLLNKTSEVFSYCLLKKTMMLLLKTIFHGLVMLVNTYSLRMYTTRLQQNVPL